MLIGKKFPALKYIIVINPPAVPGNVNEQYDNGSLIIEKPIIKPAREAACDNESKINSNISI